MDEDRGGTISKDELKKALEKNEKSSKAKRLIFEKSKTFGGSSQLDDLAEKIISELKYIISVNSINLSKLFKNFDPSNTGVLDYNAFKKLILIIDETISKEEIDYVYKIFDIDDDGTISFSEFEKYLI